MLDDILYKIKKIIPENLLEKIRPAYHYLLSLFSAIIYRFPSRHIFVVGVTGTKGKTSVTELINAILEEAGYKTALAGTLRFKIGEESKSNLYKMTMPGRSFIQKFLRQAVDAKCDYAIVEITSEGAKLFRNRFIDLDVLVFTNLAPEHIESHGSYENYLKAKLGIAKRLEVSSKKKTFIIANIDDKEGQKFLEVKATEKHGYSLKDAKPFEVKNNGLTITIDGQKINSLLQGKFNIYNILAATTFAKSQNIGIDKIKSAIEKLKEIKGRVEKIEEGQDFSVIVDYAHTPDSLEKLYEAFPNSKKICVLGNTGGGRDKWKRKVMGGIADKYCEHIILTNEDPYDEDPRTIVEDMTEDMQKDKYEIIMDRREAFAKAISMAKTGDTILITGKGTDPYIMGANNTKQKWSDAEVAREELRKIRK